MKQGSSLIDHVVCQITDAVLSEQEWLPGERLPNELQLAEKYAVSRNTIREAIKILNANHILITKPHSGTYVAQNPGMDEDPFGFAEVEEKYQLMLDLYELRALVEGAAARFTVQRASDEEIQEILRYERLCRELILAGKPWSEADRNFHAAIASASHNIAFNRIIPSIHQSAYLGYCVMDEKRNQENTLRYHALIAEGLARRDEVGASMASRYHLRQAVEDLKLTMAERGIKVKYPDRKIEPGYEE